MSDTAEAPRSGSVLIEFDLASLARGTLSLRREWTDVVQEVEAAVESCTWALIGSGHTLCVEVPDAPLPAYIDGARLRQVVTNLLDNAGKSTPDTSARSFVVKTNKDLQNVLSVPNDTMIFVESRMDPHDAPPPSPTAATRAPSSTTGLAAPSTATTCSSDRLLRRSSVTTCGLNPNIQALLPGTRLIVRRRAYFHHGIYVGNDRVIHYAGWFHSVRGLVEEVTLEQFTEGHRYSIGRTPANRQTGEQVVQRARSRLGERCYHLLRNNCEHFCNWCQLGESRSEQVETLARPTLLLFGLLQSLRSELLARLLRFRGDLPKAA